MSQFTEILVELVLCPWILAGGAYGSVKLAYNKKSVGRVILKRETH